MRVARDAERDTQKRIAENEFGNRQGFEVHAARDVDISTSIHVTSVLASRNSDLATLPRLVISSGSSLHTCPLLNPRRASRVAPPRICHDLPKFQLAETKVLDRLPDPSPIVAGALAPRSSDGI